MMASWWWHAGEDPGKPLNVDPLPEQVVNACHRYAEVMERLRGLSVQLRAAQEAKNRAADAYEIAEGEAQAAREALLTFLGGGSGLSHGIHQLL